MTDRERERIEAEIFQVAEAMEDLMSRAIPSQEERVKRLTRCLLHQRAEGLRQAAERVDEWGDGAPAWMKGLARELRAAADKAKGKR